MSEPEAPSRRPGKPTKHTAEELTDPLTRGEPANGGEEAPVELEDVPHHQLARDAAPAEDRGELDEDLDVDEDQQPVEWEPAYDEESELEADYDEEPEFEPDYDEESEFGPGFGLGADPGHPGPALKPAPGPKHGPRHHDPGPPHEHGPGPKKGPGKKAGKKAPGRKAPAKKVPGAKKHSGHPPPPPHDHGPGHRPPPPHEHGPGHGPDASGPQQDFDFGPGPDWGLGPGPGVGFGFGRGGQGRRAKSGPGRRGRPGDVRAAILTLLAERRMHGYEMIQQIAERSHDLWRPSPGSVYPALQLLVDEGLIVGSESEGSKKLFELTDEGRAAAEKIKTPRWDEITEGADAGQVDLRAALGQLVGAVAQSAYAATAEVQHRVVAILKKARREIYTLLAESD